MAIALTEPKPRALWGRIGLSCFRHISMTTCASFSE